jgi:hypothetical protein
MTSSIASLLMVFALWLTMAIFCCAGGSSGTPHKLRYRVDGKGPAHVVYSNETGGTEMQEVTLPWEKTLNTRSGEFLYISAQDKGGVGEITVSITVDGRILKSAQSSGEFTIATTSDYCCP